MMLYGIQRKGGGLLPLGKFGHQSKVEVGDYGPPRLFTTIGGAKKFLHMWLQGHWRCSGEGELPEPTKKHARDPDLYEIVEISIMVHPIKEKPCRTSVPTAGTS